MGFRVNDMAAIHSARVVNKVLETDDGRTYSCPIPDMDWQCNQFFQKRILGVFTKDDKVYILRSDGTYSGYLGDDRFIISQGTWSMPEQKRLYEVGSYYFEGVKRLAYCEAGNYRDVYIGCINKEFHLKEDFIGIPYTPTNYALMFQGKQGIHIFTDKGRNYSDADGNWYLSLFTNTGVRIW